MSRVVYLDSCVIAKLFLVEDRSEEALALVNDPEVSTVLTSDISYVEVCGVLSRAVAQGRLSAEQAHSLLPVFREWFLTRTTHFAVRLEQVMAAGVLAIDLGIRGADAIHLAAALSAQGGAALADEYVFASYDVKLAKAARATKVFSSVLA